jgi:hypothetical protein
LAVRIATDKGAQLGSGKVLITSSNSGLERE